MKSVLMLLSNVFLPDPRPLAEAKVLISSGYAVNILCWDREEDLPQYESLDGLGVKRIRLRSTHGRGTIQAFFLQLFWFKVIWYSLKEDFDIIYSHDFDTLLPGIFLKFIRRKKLIFDSHEVYSKMLGRNVWHPIIKIVEWLERLLIKIPDSIIVTCEAMNKFYLSYGASNIYIVSNWKNLDNFNLPVDKIQAEKKRLGIKEELVISYIANLGTERIIKPLLDVAKEDPGVFIIIGGDGVQKDLVKEAANAMANIRYLGQTSPEKVSLYTALSDVIYYGYDKKSGMAEFNSPNKLFEALAAGKAFLGGDFGEMGRVVKEEQCGIALSEFTEETIRQAILVFKDKSKLQVFKDNAKRAGLEKYNWGKAEKILLQALESVK